MDDDDKLYGWEDWEKGDFVPKSKGFTLFLFMAVFTLFLIAITQM